MANGQKIGSAPSLSKSKKVPTSARKCLQTLRALGMTTSDKVDFFCDVEPSAEALQEEMKDGNNMLKVILLLPSQNVLNSNLLKRVRHSSKLLVSIVNNQTTILSGDVRTEVLRSM